MSTPTPEPSGSLHASQLNNSAAQPAATGLGTFLRARLPTALTVLAFAVFAVWGFRTEWKFTNPFTVSPAVEQKPAEESRDSDVTPGSKSIVEGPCPLDRTRVRLKSADIPARMGLETALVERQPLQATVTAPAELDYDQTRLARLSSRIVGTVVRVEREVGNPVRAGDVVALIDAAEVGKAKADFLQAIAQLDLKETTLKNLQSASEAVAGKRILEEQSAVREARVHLQATRQALVNLGLPVDVEQIRKLPPDQEDEPLRLLGLPQDYIKSLDPDNTSSNLIPVVAPFDGVVVERNVVIGEVVDANKILFQVADLSRIWALADVSTDDADRVAVGQQMTFEADGHRGEKLTGKVSWTSTTVDPKTRTLRVRAMVENPKIHWRARTFGTAQISLRDHQTPVAAVPVDAIQRDGDCQYVFVRLDATTFEARAVRLGVRGAAGPRKQQWVEILSGVEVGQRVATTGVFALKAEILKDRLGGEE